MDSPPLTASPPEAHALPAERSRGHRPWVQYAIVGLLFVAVAITLARGWGELSGYRWQVDRRAVAVALGLWLVATIGAAACWLVVTRAFGIRLPIWPALRVFCTSNLGKYLPGKVLHVFARVYLVQQQGVSLALGTTSVMLDVLLYIGAGLVLSMFAIPMAASALGWGEGGIMLAIGPLAVLIGVALIHPRALNAALEIGARFVPRLRGLRFELRYRTILGAFLLYLALWLVMVLAVYAGVEAVADVSAYHLPILGAIYALSYITGLIMPTPGGVGVREAVMVPLFSFFMPAPAAIVAAILNRLLQVVAEAICAGLLSLVAREGAAPAK